MNTNERKVSGQDENKQKSKTGDKVVFVYVCFLRISEVTNWPQPTAD